MDFSVSKTMGPLWLLAILAAGIPLFFYLGTENSIVFYERLPKEPPEKGILVFYQPTCQHCIAEIPVIKELVRKGYAVSAVNVFEARELAEKYGVKVTPTIVILPSGIVLEGEHSFEDIIKAMEGRPLEFGGAVGCSIGEEKCS